jgi:hypothetical protein
MKSTPSCDVNVLMLPVAHGPDFHHLDGRLWDREVRMMSKRFSGALMAVRFHYRIQHDVVLDIADASRGYRLGLPGCLREGDHFRVFGQPTLPLALQLAVVYRKLSIVPYELQVRRSVH